MVLQIGQHVVGVSEFEFHLIAITNLTDAFHNNLVVHIQPRLDHEDVVFTLVLSLTVACVLATIIVMMLARPMAYLTLLDAHVLVPIVTVVALVGAYALENDFSHVIIATVFGILGYLMIRFQYPRITFTIALVLGEITERSFFQALGLSDGSYGIFFSRGVSQILIAMIVLTLAVPAFRSIMKRRNRVSGEA